MLKLKLHYFGHLMQRINLLENTDARKDWGLVEKVATEDEMVGWHHQLNGHEFEQAPGVGDGQGVLVCCSAWGRKELDTTEQLNNHNNIENILVRQLQVSKTPFDTSLFPSP